VGYHRPLGYPPGRTAERAVAGARAEPADVAAAQEVVAETHIEDPVYEYILDLVAASRDHPDVEHGVSPRGSLALLQMAKARAAIRGREYVISDDVKELVESVFRHRLVLTTDAELSDVTALEVVGEIRKSVAPPEAQVTDDAQPAQDTAE